MKLTRFVKLRQAISNLDFNFIANKIHELEETLSKKGKLLEPENTAVTEEGIYYINPESGMATKVVLYESDHRMKLKGPPKQVLYLTGYNDAPTISKFHKYHLMRCNNLTESENKGWSGSFRIAQRDFPSFYYRIVDRNSKQVTEKDVYQEIENQKLMICENCFLKINSLLYGEKEFKRESFELKYFFDVDFFRSWCRYGEETLAGMYPKDWETISRIRKEQVNYICEGCNGDYSDPKAREQLLVYPTDHIKKKVGYVKLECLCLSCTAEMPQYRQQERQAVEETQEI